MTDSRGAARRRFLLNAVTAAGGVGLAGFPMVAAAQGPVVFRFQGAWSARDIFHEYALDYARRVIDMSGGRLRIEVLAAGAVVKPQELLDAVHKGVLDGCHATPGLWESRNTALPLFGSGPALGMDANQLLAWMRYGGGAALYQDLYERALNANVVGLLYGPMPGQPLGWFKKPIASSAQFRGLKFRVTGPWADLYRELGVAVSDLPDGEIVAAMARGSLDGAAFGNPTSDRQLGLPGAAGVCMMQSFHAPAQVFEILYNRKKFDALPPDLRAIARHAADAAGADLSWKATHRYSTDYAEMRERREARFLKTPVEVLRAQLRAWQAVVSAKSRDNPIFEKVIESQRRWARRAVGWSLDAAADPRIAYHYWFSGKAGAAKQ